MKTTDVGLLVCWNAVSPPLKKKTNKCEVNVGESSFLLIGYGVFFIKSWHDAVQQPQGRQSPLIDNLFARSVLGCRLQLRLSSKEDGNVGVSTLDFIFHNINWKCFGVFFCCSSHFFVPSYKRTPGKNKLWKLHQLVFHIWCLCT